MEDSKSSHFQPTRLLEFIEMCLGIDVPSLSPRSPTPSPASNKCRRMELEWLQEQTSGQPPSVRAGGMCERFPLWKYFVLVKDFPQWFNRNLCTCIGLVGYKAHVTLWVEGSNDTLTNEHAPVSLLVFFTFLHCKVWSIFYRLSFQTYLTVAIK